MNNALVGQALVDDLKSQIESKKQDFNFLKRVERAVYAVAEEDDREVENADLGSIDKKMAQI